MMVEVSLHEPLEAVLSPQLQVGEELLRMGSCFSTDTRLVAVLFSAGYCIYCSEFVPKLKQVFDKAQLSM